MPNDFSTEADIRAEAKKGLPLLFRREGRRYTAYLKNGRYLRSDKAQIVDGGMRSCLVMTSKEGQYRIPLENILFIYEDFTVEVEGEK